MVVLQKEKAMALNAIVVETFGEPTLMVLQKQFEKYQKVQQKEYKLLETVSQQQMVDLEGYKSSTKQAHLQLGDWFQGLWKKSFFATSFNISYSFGCVVVKVAFGIGDAPFDLEENWGE